MDTVFVFVIFSVFATSVLVVLMLGGSIYKNISKTVQESFHERTSFSYIWSKVKNGDTSMGIRVGEFHELPALYLEENFDGVTYLTAIYLYDGWIRELVSEEGLGFTPEAGMEILEAGSLDFEQLEGGLIRVTIDGKSLLIYPRVQSHMSS